MTTIRHIIFLIHPCCYERYTAAAVQADNLSLFVEREREVKQRWLDALAQRPVDTLFVQLYGPEELQAVAVEHLGLTGAVYLKADFPGDKDMREFYRRLLEVFHVHVREHNLEFNPDAVTSELWGESFEGCVSGYGGAFAEHLGLRIAPKMRFEMTVFDTRFIHEALGHEVIPIPGTDVEAWLFRCRDTTSAATFQSRRTAQWLDQRRVVLALDDRRVQVATKQGHTLWPETPWKKGKPEQPLDYAAELLEFSNLWIHATGLAYDDFREVIRAARIVSP